ncbi:Vacuolar protein-sorting-associated protein 27 [Coemansia sp. Benny D115]|nr:Vacuolar protein-sorting-associated protein 27 [Coemansia sp. Benny D115]
MVQRFWYGDPIENEVNRLTAEDVPNHELDITGALNFADQIRSKEFSAKDVARVLRKRLDNDNPNVQILVLSLADICVKNGGNLIQLEISRREFIDDIAGLLESKTGRDHELRQTVLRIIQEWAHLFRGSIEMGYPCGVYDRLKRTGYSFPRMEVAASNAMVDTASAPEWEDSPVCQRCRTSFTFTNRKHHCRHCGKCFCNDCSSNSTTIPKFAIYDPVRVCHGCYLRLKKIVPDSDVTPSSSPATNAGASGQASRYRNSVSSASRPATTVPTPHIDDSDEDLKRAIELSLQESQKRPNYADYTLKPIASANPPPAASPAATYATASYTYAPASTSNAPVSRYPTVSVAEQRPPTNAPAAAPAAAPENDDEDPDLLAAIEASLRDMPSNAVPDYMPPAADSHALHSSAQDYADNRDFSEPDEIDITHAFMPVSSVVEDDSSDPLTLTEKENVQLFEALLTRIRDSGQDIHNDPQIQYLHENIGQLHPKVTIALDTIEQKNKEFNKLLDRISTAIKIYDQLLDKRLRPQSYVASNTAVPNVLSYLPSQQSVYSAPLAQQAAYAPPAQQNSYQVPQPFDPSLAPSAPGPGISSQQQQQQQQQQVQGYWQNPSQQQLAVPVPPPSVTPGAGNAASPGYNPNISYLPSAATASTPHSMHPQQQQVPPPEHVASPAAQYGASPAYHQTMAPSQSPPMNPHYVPPAVSHVPSIPVLQPTPAPNASALQTPAQTTPGLAATNTQLQQPAVVSAPEPEEAPLIEF